MPSFSFFAFARQLIWVTLLVAFALVQPVRAEASRHESAAESAETTPPLSGDVPLKATSCSDKGKDLVQIDAHKDYGEVCDTSATTVLARVVDCLSRGMEAVLVQQWSGVVCASPSRGSAFLNALVGKRLIDSPEQLDAKRLCAQLDKRSSEAQLDKRILPRTFIKDLVREFKSRIDPKGIRIIGALFCEGVDLSGLELPYTLALDRSVVRCQKSTECRRSPVEVRNFRTKGDFSLDSVVSYERVLVTRAEISGSFFSQIAYVQKLVIANSSIGGSLKLNGSFIPEELVIENVKVSGDLDVSSSFFSQFSLLKSSIEGSLDVSKSQARCSYDMRKNDIDDVVAVNLGFGRVLAPFAFKPDEAVYAFTRSALNQSNASKSTNSYERYIGTQLVADNGARFTDCEKRRAIDPGVFIFIDNHIKYSLCVSDFGWLVDERGHPQESNIYLNEDVVDGAAWLDIERPREGVDKQHMASMSPKPPVLSIFNFRAETLVLDFDVAKANILVKVNGLHFQRVYNAKGDCETALSPRSSARQSDIRKEPRKRLFPPDLQLPKAEEVTAWVKKNKFEGTQPFQEFVAVFEKAGDFGAAREIKILAETAAVKSGLCKSWGVHCDGDENRQIVKPQPKQDEDRLHRLRSWIVAIIQWLEGAFVSAAQYALWLLADHGYKPERAAFFVAGAIFFYWMALPLSTGIVAFSVREEKKESKEHPKLRPIGMVFLFDKLVPAYKIREDHSKQLQFYVISSGTGDETYAFRRFWKTFYVREASDKQQQRGELCLDGLRFVGLVLAIFLAAAITRLVRE